MYVVVNPGLVGCTNGLLRPRIAIALQNDIIVHEFTHGITGRLTCGGAGRCLQIIEAGGMREGSHTLFLHRYTLTTVSYRSVRRYGRICIFLRSLISLSLTNPNHRWIEHKDRPGLRSSKMGIQKSHRHPDESLLHRRLHQPSPVLL